MNYDGVEFTMSSLDRKSLCWDPVCICIRITQTISVNRFAKSAKWASYSCTIRRWTECCQQQENIVRRPAMYWYKINAGANDLRCFSFLIKFLVKFHEGPPRTRWVAELCSEVPRTYHLININEQAIVIFECINTTFFFF